jgi:geranylgeranyl diphosphate/geranylgeranyl-bacteriochlorophyllide a reductase
MYDVVIVGAGPAGATLARLVGRSLRTLLLERRPPGAGPLGARQAKCCGGLLAPDAQRALAALGLGLPREVLVGPQLFAVRAIDVASGRERHYARSYVNVDRGRLDAWLRSLVPPEVEVRPGSRFVALRDEGGDGVAVEVETQGGRRTERARLVVGADGAASGVRRQALPGACEPATYLAVQEWFEARRAEPCYTAVFDPGVTDFYGWAIPKADRIVVGAALRPGPGALTGFARLVRTLADFGVRFGRSLGREGTMLYRPRRPSHVALGAGRVALVGEAAGLVSPSSAEGVSSALRSASALAAALAPGIDGWASRYRAEVAALRRAILLKNLKAPILYTAALRRAVLATGIGAIAVGEPPALAAGEGAAAPLR